MLDRTLLARYLRQRAELGERELFLDSCSAEQILAALAGPRVVRERASGQAGERGQQPATSPSRTVSPAPPSGPQVDRRAMIREVLGGGESMGATAPPAPVALSAPVAHTRATPLARSDDGPLSLLAQEARACHACALAQTRHEVVFGEGSPQAELVIVGEAPGQEEDRTGRPFVGQAGKLLDLLLMSAGFPRESVYICNTLKCRPPQNRNPLPDELAACATFLKRQLEAIRPKVLLAVGKFAGQTLIGSEDSISRLRGRVFRYEGVPLVVTYHPAYLLRSPQWTRTVWEDFQLARKVLDEQA